ncbi:MAG TPA: FAD-binding domain-containing protein [Lutibacter sp.]|nr:FAD-binding domain-containing protein [Lutibacter sp.]
MIFDTKYEKILEKLHQIDPVNYARSRNYVDGAVTYLSPYISRGVISTRQVLEFVLDAGYEPHKIEKFIQELAWRDYWQQLWISNKSRIDEDLKHPQVFLANFGMPESILNHQTGIEAIDGGIEAFYKTGYLHNHLRMYISAIACNVAKSHWKTPAQWMYYHLLDADWASNALSWQWVCGANSNKLYVANQENINRYCHTNQQNTFLDIAYEDFASLEIPEELHAIVAPILVTPLPKTGVPEITAKLPTLVYNFYNLDPNWRSDLNANRILLLEPSVFEKYAVSQKSIDFCLALAKDNIPNVKIWVAEFSDLKALVQGEIYFKEHPLNSYVGIEDSRAWMTNVKGNFPSFFAFWKKCKKELF